MSQRLEIINVFHHLYSPLPTSVAKSVASGQRLFTNGHLGGDLLYMPPNEAFPLHSHPGDHLLLVVKGQGTVTFDGVIYPTHPGDIYMVEGGVPHAVGAGAEGHWLIAIGAPHKDLASDERMKVLEDDDVEIETIGGSTVRSVVLQRPKRATRNGRRTKGSREPASNGARQETARKSR